MVENIAKRGVSTIDLMRVLSSNFDDNVIIAGSTDVGLISSGMPMAMWWEKAGLLRGIQVTFAAGISSSSDLLEQENMQLRNENLMLRDTISRIEERLAGIEAFIPVEKVVVLREISRDEAKQEITKLFSTGKTLYYSDIVEQLKIDLELVVDICDELIREGKIQVGEAAT
jgi:hypothetical protein